MINTPFQPDRSSRPPRYSDPQAGSERLNTTIATEKISVEWKIFFLDLQENHRGRYFKITEDVNGRRDTIIVPLEAAPLVLEAVKRLVAESDARPM